MKPAMDAAEPFIPWRREERNPLRPGSDMIGLAGPKKEQGDE